MTHELYFEDVNVGDAVPSVEKDPVSKDQIWRYAGASGDFNPLHMDDEWGTAAGMGGRIAHGMLLMGFVGQAITSYVPKKYLKKFSVRFGGMTKLNDVISISGTIKDKRTENGENIITGEVSAADQNGDVKVSGTFDAALPSK
ncbi:MAG: MaoC/PaaZ C-terminal domain-containing protein [Dehalococcoidia bacterium]